MRTIRNLTIAALSASAAAITQAAVPAGAEAVFTGLATDFGTISGYAFVCLAAVTGGTIVLGLVKKMARKATS